MYWIYDSQYGFFTNICLTKLPTILPSMVMFAKVMFSMSFGNAITMKELDVSCVSKVTKVTYGEQSVRRAFYTWQYDKKWRKRLAKQGQSVVLKAEGQYAKSMWHVWQTEWKQIKFFYENLSSPVSVSFHLLPTHSFITDAT